jgi:hypothetical protein
VNLFEAGERLHRRVSVQHRMSPLALLALAAVTRVPIDLNGNTTFVQVKVNGAGPYSFIVDTGAALVVGQPRRRREARPPRARGQRSRTERGVPSRPRACRTSRSGRRRDALRPRPGVVPDDGDREQRGRRIDGVLGAELFQKYVVELDYVASRMTLYEPKEFSAEGRGKGLSLSFHDNHPYVHAG